MMEGSVWSIPNGIWTTAGLYPLYREFTDRLMNSPGIGSLQRRGSSTGRNLRFYRESTRFKNSEFRLSRFQIYGLRHHARLRPCLIGRSEGDLPPQKFER